MADTQLTGSAPVRAEENIASSAPFDISALLPPSPDHDLEAAAFRVGEHPELASTLAAEIGIGAGKALRRSPERPKTLLHAVLSGRTVAPPGGHEWWAELPAGVFDGAIARVMGLQESEFAYSRSRTPSGHRWQGCQDQVGDLAQEVQRSYSFCRYVSLLEAALTDGDEDSIAFEIGQLGAVAFLAGWFLAHEHEDARRNLSGKEDTNEAAL